jgi:hypothetical protein
MPMTQQIMVMAFGALMALIGLTLLFRGREARPKDRQERQNDDEDASLIVPTLAQPEKSGNPLVQASSSSSVLASWRSAVSNPSVNQR